MNVSLTTVVVLILLLIAAAAALGAIIVIFGARFDDARKRDDSPGQHFDFALVIATLALASGALGGILGHIATAAAP